MNYKRFQIILLTLLFHCNVLLFSQELSLNLYGGACGFNVNNTSSGNLYEFLPSASISSAVFMPKFGLSYSHTIKNRIVLDYALNYSYRGSGIEKLSTIEERVTLNYIGISPNIRFEVFSRFFVGLGIGVDYLLKGTVAGTNTDPNLPEPVEFEYSTNGDQLDTYTRYDVRAEFIMKYLFKIDDKTNLGTGVFIDHSLIKIYESDFFGYSYYNNSFGLLISLTRSL